MRRALKGCYPARDAGDSVEIVLPKGTYRPRFNRRAPEQAGSERSGAGSPAIWPRILVMPFHNLTGDAACDYLAQGLASELAIELSQYRETEILLGVSEDDPRNREAAAGYEVRGTLTQDGKGLRVSVQVLSVVRRQVVWGQSRSFPATGPERGSFLGDLVSSLAAMIAGECGVVARHMRERLGERISFGHGAYEAVMRYHHFERSLAPAAFGETFEALEQAVARHPDCAPCRGYLARLLGFGYAHGVLPEPSTISRAVELAREGVQLTPFDQRGRTMLAYVLLLNDQVGEARREAVEALALNPDSLLILDGLGYVLTLAGDWELGPALSARAVRLNPFHLPVVHGGLWLDALRRGEYEEARGHASSFMTPASFWGPLMKAVALAHLARLDEARVEVTRLLELRPDFAQRSAWYVSRYVKFDSLIAPILQGLERAGIQRAG
ncbi:MAG: hypothetical protein H7A46_25270 [Verrucomicrobiales bacterium]|nr:hypothetical protein [Verrucomicrobiales bacterium]